MRTVILCIFMYMICSGIAWAAQPQQLEQPSVPMIQSQMTSVLPAAKPYIPVGSVNLTEVWLQSPAARMYWNGVLRPTQINIGAGGFRDPALVPLLSVGKEKTSRSRQKRSGASKASRSSTSEKCKCLTAVKCACAVSASRCACAPSAAVKPPRTAPAAALTLPAPALAVQSQSASSPAASANLSPTIPPLPAAAGQRPPAIPKTPTRLQ